MSGIIKITFAIIGIIIGAGFASRAGNILIFLLIWKMGNIWDNHIVNIFRNNSI